MPTDIPDSFGSGDIRFVCDKYGTHASLPGATNIPYDDFGGVLSRSSRLPPLGTAPVSAWILARLAALCGRRFPFSSGDVFGSDGDDFRLHFIAFTTTDSIRAIGKLCVSGDREDVRLTVHSAPSHSPRRVRDAFSATLLESPTDVRPIWIVVVYTALEDEDHWKRIPYRLGWNGSSYLLEDSPEDAIDPDEYE